MQKQLWKVFIYTGLFSVWFLLWKQEKILESLIFNFNLNFKFPDCKFWNIYLKDFSGFINSDGSKEMLYIYPNEVPIQWYLFFSFSLFFIGILGIVFNRKNIINLMLSVELMLFGASLNFIFFSIFLSIPSGQIFALIIITIAAADSAIGLGILIAAFYLKRNITFEAFSSLKG